MHAFVSTAHNAITDYVALTHGGLMNQRKEHLPGINIDLDSTLFFEK
jgi:hypothetical protein